MAEKTSNPMDDSENFDFDLDLTETEMMWEKTTEEITDIPAHKTAASNNVEITDYKSGKSRVPVGAKISRVESTEENDNNSAGKDVRLSDKEDLNEIDEDGPPSPSILSSSSGPGLSSATRENSINALRESQNAFRDDIDSERKTVVSESKSGDVDKKEKSKDINNYEVSGTDDDRVKSEDVRRKSLDGDDEKVVVVNLLDTVDLTDQGSTDLPSLGDDTNMSNISGCGMDNDDMNCLLISSSSDTHQRDAQLHEERQGPADSSVSTKKDRSDLYTDVLPLCIPCCKAKEKRNCTHRHHPYHQAQSPSPESPSGQGQGGARGVGRGASVEQLVKTGVKPNTSRGRNVSSPDLGLEAVKKESKKLKYSVEVQHVKEIFPAVHRHFVKKLLKYMENRFGDKETILQHAVTYLSDHTYPTDGDSQWEIDAAIDSLKNVVITPVGRDIPKQKVHKPSKDSFVSNWITQSDFKKAMESVTAGLSTDGESGASESSDSGVSSRLFGFSNPDTLNVNLGLHMLSSGTSVRSLGTSVASIRDSPRSTSPLSLQDSSGSSVGYVGNSPERASELVGNSSDTSVDSVKHLGGSSVINLHGELDFLDFSPFHEEVKGPKQTTTSGHTSASDQFKLRLPNFLTSPSTQTSSTVNTSASGSIQAPSYTDKYQDSSEMEVETKDITTPSQKIRDDFTEKLRKDQEQFKKAVAAYKKLEAKKAAKNEKNKLKKDSVGGQTSSGQLSTDGTLRLGDVRPKVTVAESAGRYHPYPQADKKSSVQEFSFSAPLVGSKPDSVGHTSTISYSDITSSIKEDEMIDLVVSSSSINCEHCRTTHALTDLGQCCDGHLLCKACLEKAAKLILVGNKSGQVICPVTDCGSSVPRSELRKCLHSVMLDLLDEKWNKEAVEAMNEMEDFVRCPGCGYSVILDLSVKLHCCEKCKKTFCRCCNLDWSAKKHDFCIKTKSKKTSDGLGFIAIPAHWSATSNQDEPYEEVVVDKSSLEYTNVTELFHATMKREAFTVENLYRIQNQRLWEKYMLMRAHMVADLGEIHINEQRLFHGTSSEVIPAICTEGFDWRMFGKNGSAFGQGTYFARDAIYSHNYSAKNGPYVMSTRNWGRHSGISYQLMNIMALRRQRNISGGFNFGNQLPAQTGSGTIPLPLGPPGSGPAQLNTNQQQQGFVFGGPPGNQPQSLNFSFDNQRNSNTGNQLPTGFPFATTVTANAGNQQSTGGTNNTTSGSQQHQQDSSTGFGFGSFPNRHKHPGMGFSYNICGIPPISLAKDDTSMDIPSGNFMFVGRVLVGRICRGTPDMRRPPKDESDPLKRPCHTAVNHPNKPTIFVVFESAQCYPEYIIEYHDRM